MTDVPVRKLPLALRWLPAMLLLWLSFFPPHGIDASISGWFFSDGRWAGDAAWFEMLLHEAPKIITAAAVLFCTLLLIANSYVSRRSRSILSARFSRDLLTGLIAAAASFAVVWWLKRTTGVSCPWSADIFGGTAALSSPIWGFAKLPGNCWPAGHAGTGFALYGLALALWRRDASLGRKALLAVTAFGLVLGFSRVLQGAHFVSHVLATMMIDWTIAVAAFSIADALAVEPALRTAPRPAASGIKALWARLPRMPYAVGIAAVALWWTAVYNRSFLTAASGGSTTSLLFLAAAFWALSAALIGLLGLLPRRIFQTCLGLLHIIGALAAASLALYGTVLTPDMMRNVFSTDPAEAAGYLSVRSVAFFLALAMPPLVALALTAAPKPDIKSFLFRLGGAAASLAAGLGLMLADMQGFAGAMRADKTLRYRIAPVNALWSAGATLAADASPDAKKPRIVVDASAAMTPAKGPAPFLVVVIGETTRAANWSLSGYDRPTAEPLAKRLSESNFANLPSVEACGTSTDVSLPCMLSRIGRSSYDRKRILAEEALPALLARAGARVEWIDNQSGCKGTCAGVPTKKAACSGGACFDGVLAQEMRRALTAADLDAQNGKDRPTVLFLHMMGSHGPAYSQRSPADSKVWTPECLDADLSSCPKEAVVNAYDNSVRYTAEVLASMIAGLEAASDRPTALLYMSDHGESLGEKGLYLHGAPYMLAPDEQTRVPGLLWVSPAWQKMRAVDMEAVRRNAPQATHEHLWSTVLGLLDVKSTTYRRAFDLTKPAP